VVRAEKLIFIAGNKGCRNVSEEQEGDHNAAGGGRRLGACA
jgi:hypothetical protein